MEEWEFMDRNHERRRLGVINVLCTKLRFLRTIFYPEELKENDCKKAPNVGARYFS